jgi:pimeloyl-ACP methyl ester carboxylesterase
MVNDSSVETAFCGADSARMYVALHRSTKPGATTLVFCPPLHQEMVNTYGRFARWGKQLATRGYSVLRYHPLGMGESGGTHADVTLESLVKDAATAQRLARQQIGGPRLGYLGVRVGATVSILAAALEPADFVVLWSPLTNLRHYFRELLRSQVTSDAIHRSRTRSTEQMIADLEAGRNVDVWGYELSAGLYHQMKAMQVLPDTPPARHVLWLARPTEEAGAAPIVKRWQELGSQVDFRILPEPVFWENPGNAVPERFATATVQWLSQRGD